MSEKAGSSKGFVVLNDQYRLVPYTYGWKVVHVYEGKTKKGEPVTREDTLAYFSRLETAIRWLLAWDVKEHILKDETSRDLKALAEMLEVRIEQITSDLLEE